MVPLAVLHPLLTSTERQSGASTQALGAAATDRPAGASRSSRFVSGTRARGPIRSALIGSQRLALRLVASLARPATHLVRRSYGRGVGSRIHRLQRRAPGAATPGRCLGRLPVERTHDP